MHNLLRDLIKVFTPQREKFRTICTIDVTVGGSIFISDVWRYGKCVTWSLSHVIPQSSTGVGFRGVRHPSTLPAPAKIWGCRYIHVQRRTYSAHLARATEYIQCAPYTCRGVHTARTLHVQQCIYSVHLARAAVYIQRAPCTCNSVYTVRTLNAQMCTYSAERILHVQWCTYCVCHARARV